MATPATGLTAPASAAVSAFKSGSNPLAAGLSESDSQTTDPSDANRSEDDTADDAGLDSVADLANDSIDDPDDVDGEEGSDALDDESADDSEELEVTGDKNKQKISINWRDRDGIKKQLQKGYAAEKGMRKFQAERDSARAEVTGLKQQFETAKDKAASYDILDQVWQEKGVEGLVEKLSGGKQTWDQLVDAKLAQRQKIALMTPGEQEAYRKQQKAEEDARQAQKVQKDYEKKLAEIDARQERAEKQQLQTYMDEPFGKYRFAGKLGNDAREHRLDSMLWNGVRAELMKLPDEVEITPQLIAREFKQQAAAIRGAIKEQVRGETTKVIRQKKSEAKNQAQVQMKTGSRTPSSEQDMRKALKDGNIVSAVTSWLSGNKKK